MRRRSGLTSKVAPFSRSVKDELAQLALPRNTSVARAELAGLMVRWHAKNHGDEPPYIATGHPSVARRAFNLYRVATGRRASLEAGRATSQDRRLRFRMIMDPEAAHVLVAPVDADQHGTEEMRAYMRGVFLLGGSINDPRSGYHCELRPSSRESATHCGLILEMLGIDNAFVREDRVYIKDAESIADFLRVLGAPRSLLRFEDIRVMREVRNRVNRRINFETANMNKSVEAAVQQIEDLDRLPAEVYDNLSRRTREILRLRVEQPEASLRELGEMANPPVTKSTVEYHFRKIRDLAKQQIAES